jgi:hypothetical protein
MAYCAGNWDRNDKLLGTVFIPGTKGIYKSVNGEVLIEINSLGLRDEDFPLEKPEGEKRILVLGDSFVEALQVPLEQTFLKLLEDMFLPDKVRVINGGHSGYGQAEQLLFWRYKGSQLAPDLVILFFYANDIIDNSIDLDPWQKRPFFVMTESETLQLINKSPEPSWLKKFLGEHLYLYHFVRIRGGVIRNYLYTFFKRSDLKVELARDAKASPEQSSKPEDASIAEDPFSEAWNITSQLLKQLDFEISKTGAAVLVVNAGQPPVSEKKEYYSKKLTEICVENKIPLFDLQTVIDREYAKNDKPFFTDHYSPFGHEVVARVLHQFIVEGFPQVVSPRSQSGVRETNTGATNEF